MPLTMMSDILFRDVPNPVRLRELVARVFDLPVALVNLRTIGDLDRVDPASRIQLTREPDPLPGDFADWYGLSVDTTLIDQVTDGVDAIASALGMPLLTDAEDDEEMTLHLPDGTHQMVRLTQDDDDAFRITPEMQRLIDASGGQSSTAVHRRKAIAS